MATGLKWSTRGDRVAHRRSDRRQAARTAVDVFCRIRGRTSMRRFGRRFARQSSVRCLDRRGPLHSGWRPSLNRLFAACFRSGRTLHPRFDNSGDQLLGIATPASGVGSAAGVGELLDPRDRRGALYLTARTTRGRSCCSSTSDGGRCVVRRAGRWPPAGRPSRLTARRYSAGRRCSRRCPPPHDYRKWPAPSHSCLSRCRAPARGTRR